MAGDRLSAPNRISSLDISCTSTMVPISGSSSSSGLAEKVGEPTEHDITESTRNINRAEESSAFEEEFHKQTEAAYSSMAPRSKTAFKIKLRERFSPGGKLRPFRLLRQDIRNIRRRYISDWTLFNQLILASAVYVLFTNILPGITFASDLYVLTGMT